MLSRKFFRQFEDWLKKDGRNLDAQTRKLYFDAYTRGALAARRENRA